MKYEMKSKSVSKLPISIMPMNSRKTRYDYHKQYNRQIEDKNNNQIINNNTQTPPAAKSSFPPVLNSLIYQNPLIDIHNYQRDLSTSHSHSHSKKQYHPHSQPKSPITFKTSYTKILPPKHKRNLNKKTLLIDLDETLIHSSFIIGKTPPDIILNFNLDNKKYTVYVSIRPGVDLFLDKMNMNYELIIFTASLSDYANPLIDKLDKKGRISHRLFRDSCTFANNSFIKTLDQINRNLKDVILLDNNPASYYSAKSNGFPISTWIDNKEDKELFEVIPLLMYLSHVSDVRKYICHMNKHNDFTLGRANELDSKGTCNEDYNPSHSNSNSNNSSAKTANVNLNVKPNSNLKQIIETSNETTEREPNDSISKRNEKKININIVNNNYNKDHINENNSGLKEIITCTCNNKNTNSPMSNLNMTSTNFNQYGSNTIKLKKNISQYKTIASILNDNNNDTEGETNNKRQLAIFTKKKTVRLASYRPLQSNPLISKGPIKPISKRQLELNSFRFNDNKSSCMYIVENSPLTLKNKKTLNHTGTMLSNTPKMNRTNTSLKPMLITKYPNRDFLDDPFLKQGWTTSRSNLVSLFQSKSMSNFKVPSSISHKLKNGMLFRNSLSYTQSNGSPQYIIKHQAKIK